MINKLLRTEKSIYIYAFGFAFSMLYAYFFTTLPGEILLDREWYLNYSRASESILLRYWSEGGLLTLLANEPIWLFMNMFLSLFISSSEIIVHTIIFVSAFLLSYTILTRDKRVFLLLLILLLPQVIKNEIIHLRQGVAVAIFIYGYYFIQNNKLKNFMFMLTPFIHSSFFFILFLFYLVKLFKSMKFSNGLTSSFVLFISIGILLSLSIISSVLGARQGEKDFSDINVSGISFLVWSIYLIILLIQKKDFIKKHLFSIAILIFYLSGYFLTSVSARIFESGIVIVLFSGLDLKGWSKLIYYGFLLAFFVSQYYIMLNKPFLGFAI